MINYNHSIHCLWKSIETSFKLSSTNVIEPTLLTVRPKQVVREHLRKREKKSTPHSKLHIIRYFLSFSNSNQHKLRSNVRTKEKQIQATTRKALRARVES